MFCGTNRGVIAWYDFENNKLTKEVEFTAHLDSVRTINYHPQRKVLMTTARDGAVKLWDASSDNVQPKILGNLVLHIENVPAASFVNNDLVLTGSWDQKLALWSIKDLLKWLSSLNKFKTKPLHTSSIHLEFSFQRSADNRWKSIKNDPFFHQHLTFKDSFLIVGKHQIVLDIDENFSPTWLPQQKFIDSPCMLGQNYVLVVSLVLFLTKLSIEYLANRIVLQFLQLGQNLPLQKIKINKNCPFFCLSLFVSIDQPEQTEKLFTFNIKLYFFLFRRRTTIEPNMV